MFYEIWSPQILCLLLYKAPSGNDPAEHLLRLRHSRSGVFGEGMGTSLIVFPVVI